MPLGATLAPNFGLVVRPVPKFGVDMPLGATLAPNFGLVVRPVAARPVRIVTLASASAARRSTHSNVVRRQAIITRSSSPGSGANSISGGRLSPKRISVAPSASSASRMSGWWSRSRLRNRARKAWL